MHNTILIIRVNNINDFGIDDGSYIIQMYQKVSKSQPLAPFELPIISTCSYPAGGSSSLADWAVTASP